MLKFLFLLIILKLFQILEHQLLKSLLLRLELVHNLIISLLNNLLGLLCMYTKQLRNNFERKLRNKL